jgi:hypothetical protein
LAAAAGVASALGSMLLDLEAARGDGRGQYRLIEALRLEYGGHELTPERRAAGTLVLAAVAQHPGAEARMAAAGLTLEQAQALRAAARDVRWSAVNDSRLVAAFAKIRALLDAEPAPPAESERALEQLKDLAADDAQLSWRGRRWADRMIKGGGIERAARRLSPAQTEAAVGRYFDVALHEPRASGREDWPQMTFEAMESVRKLHVDQPGLGDPVKRRLLLSRFSRSAERDGFVMPDDGKPGTASQVVTTIQLQANALAAVAEAAVAAPAEADARVVGFLRRGAAFLAAWQESGALGRHRKDSFLASSRAVGRALAAIDASASATPDLDALLAARDIEGLRAYLNADDLNARLAAAAAAAERAVPPVVRRPIASQMAADGVMGAVAMITSAVVHSWDGNPAGIALWTTVFAALGSFFWARAFKDWRVLRSAPPDGVETIEDWMRYVEADDVDERFKKLEAFDDRPGEPAEPALKTRP